MSTGTLEALIMFSVRWRHRILSFIGLTADHDSALISGLGSSAGSGAVP